LVVITAVLPRFDGALKDQVYAYDRGLLRLQFGNSMLLLPGVAYVLWRTLRQPSALRMGWLALLVGAQLLSLTRVSVFMTLGVAVVVLVLHLRHGRAGRRPRWRSAGVAAVVLVVSMVAAVGLSTLGSGSTGASGRTPENPIERIAFLGSESDFGTTIDSISSGGRFSTYFNAIEEISHSPVLGGGLGQLVDVRFAFDEARSRTIGTQPGVDDAYLTVGLKAGAIGMVVFGGLLLLSLRSAMGRKSRRIRPWYVPAWVGVLGLTLTQGFAVSSYGPFVLAALAAVPFMGYAATRRSTATDQA
jgi:O-Antigen ligase